MWTQLQLARGIPFSLWIPVANSSAIWAVGMKPAIPLLCSQPGMWWMLRGLPACCLLPCASTLLEMWVVLLVLPPSLAVPEFLWILSS